MTDEIQPEKEPEITSQKETISQPKKPAKKAPEKAPDNDLAATLEKAAALTLSDTLEKKIRKEAEQLSFGTDPFQKIYSRLSKTSGYSETVKAMQIDRAGCIVKTITTINDNITETTIFVPGVQVKDIRENGKVVGRKLVHI